MTVTTSVDDPLGHDHPSVDVGSEVDPEPEISIIILVLNNSAQALRCIDSICDRGAGKMSHEVVVLANGTSLAELAPLQRRDDLVLIRSDVNLGFAGGCNRASRFARGQWLVFLNDDTEVDTHWLDNLLRTAKRRPDAGAVGARILNADGTLQEAGSILWRDGSATGAGRGRPANTAEFMVVRDVDFCSANSLLVPREAWVKVGGFSTDYFPAYYEDVDLCLRLRQAGYALVYEPRACIRHTESASTTPRFRLFLIRRHQARLARRWTAILETQPRSPSPTELPAAVTRRVTRPHGTRGTLLLVDDCIPDPGLGSGFGRMLDAIRDFRSSGYAVVIAPRVPSLGDNTFHPDGSGIRNQLADLGVPVCTDTLKHHLATPGITYDAVLISRPTNVERAIPLVRHLQPSAKIIYDTEALWHRRLERQAEAERDADRAALLATEATEYRAIEIRGVRSADAVVCISDDEARLVRDIDPDVPIKVIRPTLGVPSWGSSGFWERDAIIFTAGWLAGTDSPNHDALRFFIDDVLPHLTMSVPNIRVLVTGAAPPAEVERLSSAHIEFTGHVRNFDALYDRARVAIVPMRLGAGVKIKTVEALLHGVPTVSTRVGAEGMDSSSVSTLCVTDNGAEFAAHVAELFTNRRSWEARRRDIRAYLDNQGSGSEAGTTWSSLIEDVMESHSRSSITTRRATASAGR